MPAYNTITVIRSGQIVTLTIQSKDRKALTGPHVEIGAALTELRYDNGVRVVILTGDDAFFCRPRARQRPRATRLATIGISHRACTAPIRPSSRWRSR
jgi:1,4-dihydroxy-2-naphthoyl-CoA synthase